MRAFYLRLLIIWTIIFGRSLTCFAQQPHIDLDGIKFGPEFTFAKISHGEEDKARLKGRMFDHLIGHQPPGEKFTLGASGLRFDSPNNWWVILRDDPGVIEVSMSPMSVRSWKNYSVDIQDALFVSAYNEGLFPADYLGGGHISIDLSELIKSPLLLRNFIVDYFNHNELSMGIMNYDTNNALPISLLSPRTIESYRDLIEEFDEKLDDKVFNSPEHLTVWLNKFHKLTEFAKDGFLLEWHDPAWNRHKNIAMRIDSFGKTRLEIRAVRPQKNIDVWVRQISLFNSRIKFLAKLDKPIPFKFKVPHRTPELSGDFYEMKLNPPIHAQDALKEFFLYVKESGEKWGDHRDYIWPEWVRNGQLEKFEKSKWFTARNDNCGEYL